MKKVMFAIAIVFALCGAARPAAAACTVCHSKDPKMVSMHKALQYKDCFKCHGPATDRKTPNNRDEKTTDPLCVRCHAPAGSGIKER